MDGSGNKAWVGLVALMLVGFAGCGGDDSDDAGRTPGLSDAPGADEALGGGEGEGSDGDVCSLLETSEVEAEFGQRGPVADGVISLANCMWEVGEDQTGDDSGFVSLLRANPVGPMDEAMVNTMALAEDPVAVDGVGDEAHYDLNGGLCTLYVRSGELLFTLSSYFNTPVDGVQQKLATLAEQAISRA